MKVKMKTPKRLRHNRIVCVFLHKTHAAAIQVVQRAIRRTRPNRPIVKNKHKRWDETCYKLDEGKKMNEETSAELHAFMQFYGIAPVVTSAAQRMHLMETDPHYREWAFSLLERALYNQSQVNALEAHARSNRELRDKSQVISQLTFQTRWMILYVLFPLEEHFVHLGFTDLAPDEFTPIARGTNLAQPPVLLNPRTNYEPLIRAHCAVCLTSPVEIRTQCPIH